VKLVDANVLLYAVDEESPNHSAANGWLDEALGSREPIGFAWVVVLAFLRLSTHPRLSAQPLSLEQAMQLVEHWLGEPPSLVVHPSDRHLSLLRGLLTPLGTAANLVTDAHLAALALEHGADIVSFDRDFQRFEGVGWSEPVAP
jgi:toxin-antitoxin system PIN domain toxin